MVERRNHTEEDIRKTYPNSFCEGTDRPHHWLLESPNGGPTVDAACVHCSKTRAYPSGGSAVKWNNDEGISWGSVSRLVPKTPVNETGGFEE